MVTDPQSDWGRFANGNDGKVSSMDEWIELYNDSGTGISLKDWRLEMIDSTPETEIFDEVLLAPGGFFLYMNPKGLMNNDSEFFLYDSNGNLIDMLSLRSNISGIDGNANSVENESVSRVLDFSRLKKTPASPKEKNIFLNTAPQAVIRMQGTKKTE